MHLADFGWIPFFVPHFQVFAEQNFTPARVTRADGAFYQILCEQGPLSAEVSGKFRHSAAAKSDFPTVGDWVVIQILPGEDRATIHGLLPRKSRFSRQAVNPGGRGENGGKVEEQVVAANVDTVFLVNGLDGGRSFQLQRLERYLTLAWDSGASPVIVLNKADLCPEVEVYVAEAETIALGVPVHAVSAVEKQGLDDLRPYLDHGQTAVFLGPSGVGKSTLINSLLGDDQLKIGSVRDDDRRGRHTTTWSELRFAPSGGMIIDTPGMRDIQMWADEDSLKESFEDIEALAPLCRFGDCRHEREPGCAVLEAIERGELEESRLHSFRKLQREIQYLTDRQEQKGRKSAKEQWQKQIAKVSRQWKKSHHKR